MIIFKLILFLLLLNLQITCLAQDTFKINGSLISNDFLNTKGLILKLSQNSFIKNFTTSNEFGFFEFAKVKRGNYQLQINDPKYKIYDTIILVDSLNNPNLSIIIQPKSKVLDTIIIRSIKDYYQSGDSVIYNAEKFKRGNENNLKDLLNKLPDIAVDENSRITYMGKMVDRLLIDGKDLTGSAYEKIVNNLSPHNISQVQIIKNYKDPFELTNYIADKGRLAMNISFKKKKIVTTAKFSLSLGIPINFTEQNTDFILSHKGFTSFNVFNYNTIGKSAEILVSKNGIKTNFNKANTSQFQKENNYLNEPLKIYLPIERKHYNFNNTLFYDNSFQFNLKNKILLRTIISGVFEKSNSNQTRTSKTFIGNDVFSERNEQVNINLEEKNNAFSNEIIFVLKPNKQIKLNTQYVASNINGKENLDINSIQNITNNNNRKQELDLSIALNTLRKNYTFISYFAEISNTKINENLLSKSIPFKDVFFNSNIGTLDSLRNDAIQKSKKYHLGLIYKFSKYETAFEISPYFTSTQSIINTDLGIITDYSLKLNIDSFSNYLKLNQAYLSTNFNVYKQFKHSEVSFKLEPVYFFKNSLNTINEKNQGLKLNYNFVFTLKRKTRNFLLMANNAFTYNEIQNAFNNNQLIYNIAIFKGIKNFTYNNLSIYSLRYFTNLFTKKPTVFFDINYIVNKSNFIRNTSINNFYGITNLRLQKTPQKSLNSNISINIKSKKGGSIYIPSFSVRNSANIFSQNNINTQNINNDFVISNHFFTTSTRIFNFNFKNVFEISTSINHASKTKFTNYNNDLNASINVSINKKLNFDLEFSNSTFFIKADRKLINYSFLSFYYQQTLLPKVRLNLQIRNLTNTNTYSNKFTTANYFYASRTQLLPIFALCKFEILL